MSRRARCPSGLPPSDWPSVRWPVACVRKVVLASVFSLMSTLCLHAKLTETIETLNTLFLLVGPAGLEPATKGL